MPGEPQVPQWAWTGPQRRVLLVVLTLLLLFLSGRYACNRMYVSDPQPEYPARYDELADRIDPNAADWQTLAALPGVGEKRARDVVEYRERKRAEAHDPELVVFQAEGDLLRIRGIGVGILEAMRPHLVFPGPASRRSATSRAL